MLAWANAEVGVRNQKSEVACIDSGSDESRLRVGQIGSRFRRLDAQLGQIAVRLVGVVSPISQTGG